MQLRTIGLFVLLAASGCRTPAAEPGHDDPPNPTARKLSGPKLALTKARPDAPSVGTAVAARPKPAEKVSPAPGAPAAGKPAVTAPAAPAAAPETPVSAKVPVVVPTPTTPVEPSPAPVPPVPADATPVKATPAPADVPPATEQKPPAPAGVPPAPVEPAPAPAKAQPAPVEPAPAPAPAERPAPVEPAPAPAKTTPAPENTPPAPETTQPAPEKTPPAPAKAAPAPGDAAPAPADAVPPVAPRATGTLPGERIPAFDTFVRRTEGGKSVELPLESQKTGRITVYVVNSTTCPYCRDYAKRIEAIEETYMPKGVDVVHVYANRNESPEAKIAWHAKQRFLGGQIVDSDAKVAHALDADRTPTVYVVDAQGVIVYRGAIDDSPAGDNVRERWLVNALEAVLAGGKVAVASTDPPG